MDHPGLTIGELARRVENLRFQAAHGLGDDSRFARWSEALLAQAPTHPLAMNLRAWVALPETALPSPSPRLRPAAEAFHQGRLQEACELATQTLGDLGPEEVGGGHATAGDLHLALDRVDEAETHYRQAALQLSRLPPLEARLGRCALLRGDAENARRLAVRALCTNPLYGSAMVLRWEAGVALGEKLVTLPLQARAFHTPAGVRLDNRLSPRAARAWKAWAQVRHLDPGAFQSVSEVFPPELAPTMALIGAFRAQSDDDTAYSDAPDTELLLLDRWEREKILGAYLWFAGLSPDNAHLWEAWTASHPEAMERFWTKGIC